MVVKINTFWISLNLIFQLTGKTQKIFQIHVYGRLMSLFYCQKWDIVAFIMTKDKREPCRVRMRCIMTEAVLISDQCWLQTILCILKTFIERQCPVLCFEFRSVCGIRMRNIKWKWRRACWFVLFWNPKTTNQTLKSSTLNLQRDVGYLISIGKPEVCNV